MANIVLRDRSGAPVEYPGIDTIKVNTADGGTVDFVDSGSVPIAIENSPIALDFSGGGNQIVEAPEGYVVKSAIIEKPEALIGDNIKEGVEIAGIVGSLAASSGGNIALHKMTVTGTGSNQTFTHGLGVVPDIVFGHINSVSYTSTKGKYVNFFGCSGAFGEKYGQLFNCGAYVHSSDGKLWVSKTNTKIDQMYYSSSIHNATEQTIDFGGGYGLLNGIEYVVYFITGLT